MRRLLNGHMVFAVLVTGGVVLLNILPSSTIGIRTLFRWSGYVYLGDKLGHMAIFALLVVAVYAGLRTWLPRVPALIWAAGGNVIFSTATELSQMFVRSRSTNWADLTANWLGILAAGVLITVYIMLRARQPRPSRGGSFQS